jgi:hypothetical protein
VSLMIGTAAGWASSRQSPAGLSPSVSPETTHRFSVRNWVPRVVLMLGNPSAEVSQVLAPEPRNSRP